MPSPIIIDSHYSKDTINQSKDMISLSGSDKYSLKVAGRSSSSDNRPLVDHVDSELITGFD